MKNGITLPEVLFQLSICNSIIFAALLIRHAADLYVEWYLQQKNQSDEHKSGQDQVSHAPVVGHSGGVYSAT